MHKKGITEEVAKKRSRRTVKHQRGIVGADLAAIAARRNQTAQVRQAQRSAAIQKAKAEKKDKESKKEKKVRLCARREGIAATDEWTDAPSLRDAHRCRLHPVYRSSR